MGLVSFVRDLDTVGDGTGISSGVGNFAATERVLRIRNVGKQIFISELSIVLLDDADFEANGYSGMVLPLTNGVSVSVKLGGLTYDLYRGKVMRRTVDWIESVSGVFAPTFPDLKKPMLKLVQSFTKFDQDLIVLNTVGDELSVRLRDDFSSMIRHTFTVSGRMEI